MKALDDAALALIERKFNEMVKEVLSSASDEKIAPIAQEIEVEITLTPVDQPEARPLKLRVSLEEEEGEE